MILTRKLIAPTVILLVVLLTGIFAYFFSSLHGVYHEAEEGDLASFRDSFLAEMENQKQLALALASGAAGNPAIQEALAARDRERLLELAVPGYKLLVQNNSNVILYQYYLADSRLFLDVNNPADSENPRLTSSAAVVLANRQQKAVAGLEFEDGRLDIRGAVPVFYQGRHIGSVGFGLGFDKALLAALKQKYGGEWQILLSRELFESQQTEPAGPNPGLMLFATTQDVTLFNDPGSYTRALSGQSTITHPSVDGRDYAILSAPIYDYSQNVIGVLDIVYDHTHISSAQNRRLLLAGVASLGAILLGVLGLVFVVRRTLEPIQELTGAAAEIAEGKLSSYVNIRAGKDEIGILANAFNRMTSQLRGAISELEERVAERTSDLENQTLRLRAAAEIARDAASTRNLSELLERSSQLIFDRFGLHHVGIFLLDKNQDYAVLAASPTETGQRLVTEKYKVRVGKDGIVGHAAATGEPRITLDTQPEAQPSGGSVLPDTRSEMALPLKVENRIIGVLDLQSNRPRAFGSEDMAIMQILADQLATAIERTRLLEEVERNLHELEQAHGQYTREGWRRFGSSGRMIHQGYRFDNVRIEPVTELSPSGRQALSRGETVRSRSSDGKETVAIPIKLRGQTIGVVHARLKEGFEKTTLTTIESAIERLASALESARLYEEARMQAAREQSISQVTSAISASAEYEDILRTTVREIGTMLRDTEVAIQILDDSMEAQAGG